MTVFVVGASAAGLYAAIFLKSNHPDYQVVVFDRVEKVGKKMLATGNGHCNLFNLGMKGSHFNHPEFVDELLKEYPPYRCPEIFYDLGIGILKKDDLLYPLSYSASTYVKTLEDEAKSLGIEIHLNERILDYQNEPVKLVTDKGTYQGDFIIFATGGKSQENLGSDGSLFPVFEKHGYEVVPLWPSLCPVKTKEKTKAVSGVRHTAEVTLELDGKTVYRENGEVLWKDDGLSGIAVFNASAYLARAKKKEAMIYLDLFPEIPENALAKIYENSRQKLSNPLESLLETKLANYVKNYAKTEETIEIVRVLKRFPFHVIDLYPFASSQVTSGGVSLSDIDASFRSKLEDNVAFIGEVLDVDGLCGGLNLGFALLSALKVAKHL